MVSILLQIQNCKSIHLLTKNDQFYELASIAVKKVAQNVYNFSVYEKWEIKIHAVPQEIISQRQREYIDC